MMNNTDLEKRLEKIRLEHKPLQSIDPALLSRKVNASIPVVSVPAEQQNTLMPAFYPPAPLQALHLQTLAPQFSNTVYLKTLNDNLILSFAYTESTSQHLSLDEHLADVRVALSANTAKQLFCALAELMDCTILPNP